MTDDIVQENLEKYIEEYDGEESSDLLVLKVLRNVYQDTNEIRKTTEKWERNPSLMYQLRFKTIPTITGIFFVGLFLFTMYQIIYVSIGIDGIIRTLVP